MSEFEFDSEIDLTEEIQRLVKEEEANQAKEAEALKGKADEDAKKTDESEIDNLSKESEKDSKESEGESAEKSDEAGAESEEDEGASEFDELFLADEIESDEADEKNASLPANVQKKINRETARRKQLEEEVAVLRKKVAEKPKGETDSDDDLYVVLEDGRRLLDVEKANARKKERDLAALQQKVQEDFDQTVKKTHAKCSEYSKVKPDFEPVVNSLLGKLSDIERGDLFMSIAECENSPQILYMLSQPNHASKLDYLLKSKEKDVIKKLAEWDITLSQAGRKVKLTKAPPPIEKVKSGGASNTSVDPVDLPMDQFEEWYKNQSKR